jgi:hypothetical protein
MSANRLVGVFKELRKNGYFAKMNHTCCQSCGWSEIPDEKSNKVVFFHRQDAVDLCASGNVYLSWAGDGNYIVDIIKKHGMEVVWDMSDKTRILVKGVYNA